MYPADLLENLEYGGMRPAAFHLHQGRRALGGHPLNPRISCHRAARQLELVTRRRLDASWCDTIVVGRLCVGDGDIVHCPVFVGVLQRVCEGVWGTSAVSYPAGIISNWRGRLELALSLSL